MEFKNKIDAFQKMLFKGYERGDKIKPDDWYDEALDLATIISKSEDIDVMGKKISEYLESRFPEDTYKNFPMLGYKMAETIDPYL